MILSIFKLTRRTIRTFFGRYMALLLIVLLGAGFFAGLKITEAAMTKTADGFFAAQKLYDFRLLSTLGFTEGDVERFAALENVEAAEGTYSVDAMVTHGENDHPFKLLSLPGSVNLPSLVAGRMPEAADECVVDDERFGESDIGRVISLSDEGGGDAAEQLTSEQFTIVGLVDSPLYIGLDRGTTGIGSGALYSFAYLPRGAFDGEVFTEINLTLTERAAIYTDEYDRVIERHEGGVTALADTLADERYNELWDEMLAELTAELESEIYDEVLPEVTERIYAEALAEVTAETVAATGLPEAMAAELAAETAAEIAAEQAPELAAELAAEQAPELARETADKVAEENGLEYPDVYVLTRGENPGYVSFDSDTDIVSGISNIFPVFFILIAMLVCITTMTRMVDEERTQIGVLKAMGYGNAAVMAKYLLYAGSATLLGWTAGFFLCTWGLPEVFWFAYSSLYDFAPLDYLFSADLAVLTLAVSLAGILGSTFISCRRELAEQPAFLIRPRTAKNGRRILLERVTPLWNRLKFLQKITLRNMLRYKRRLVMMLVGIGCCAGLVVTAFGVRDSMVGIGSRQFDVIQRYDIEASFDAGSESAAAGVLDELAEVADYHMTALHRVDVLGDEASMDSVNLMSFRSTDGLGEFWNFCRGEEAIAFPAAGEVIVGKKLGEKLELEPGDSIEIRDSDMRSARVTVSGIFDNYVYNFVIMDDATYAAAFGEWEANTALVIAAGDVEAAAHSLTDADEITSVAQLGSTRSTVDGALACIDYIITLIVLFSGALAFIVIFNLTNINLAERSREIATVQVLGFYPRETESYVLRENLVLSVLASIIGLPLGALFHHVVMDMIVIDMFTFNVHVKPVSYLLAFVCTVLFAVVVNLFMRRQIGRIHMAESLKAVE